MAEAQSKKKEKTRQPLWSLVIRYALRHKKLVYATLAIVPLLSALNLLQPYLMKVAIDEYILKKNLHGLRLISLVFFAVFICEYLLNFLQVYLMQFSGQRIVFDLRRDLFRKLHELDAAYYQSTPVGVTLTRLTGDCEVIAEMFSSGIISLAWDLMRLVFIVITMALLDWRLTLTVFSVVPVLVVLVLFFRKRLRESYDRVREKSAALNAFVQELTGGMKIVQLFSRQNQCAKQFGEINESYKNANMDAVRYDAILYALVEGLASLAVGLMVWKGGGSLVRGTVSFGVLVAFIEYIQRFFIPIRDLSAKVAVIQAARTALDRIAMLLDKQPAILPPTAPEKVGEIHEGFLVENVSFAYEPTKPVLTDVNLRLPRGMTVALIGVTGSGKSTLFKLMNRTYDPMAGHISLDGVDLKRLDLRGLRLAVGVVSQDVFLFSGSVADNIRLFDQHYTREQVIEAASSVGADRFIQRLTKGYDHRVVQRGANLSMGERQLIALARMALFNPPVLLLDEATAHIDPATTRSLQKGMEAISQNRTVLVVAHRLETIRNADYIYVLHHGQIHEHGNHADLLGQDGIFAKLYRSEAVFQ